MKRILKPVTYALAALYFLADAAFMAIAKPISDWLGSHVVLRRLRTWIRSLRPYPSLALFSIPVIMLEPVKPVAAYLAATGQMASSVVTLIVGELLKLVLVERLFSLTRDKLMKIPAFAWAYKKLQRSQDMAEKYRGLESHSRNKQGCPSVSNRDEKIGCSGVSAISKDCGWRQSGKGLGLAGHLPFIKLASVFVALDICRPARPVRLVPKAETSLR